MAVADVGELYVKSLTGMTSTLLEVDFAQDTVVRIKQRLFDKEGIPVEMCRLAFAGRVLENANTLAHYGIQHTSTLHMALLRSDGTAAVQLEEGPMTEASE